jgi:mannitol/fructose-specific phosphotransferase system IIA component (Ntr-type)
MLGVTPRYVTPTRPEQPRRLLDLDSCFKPEHILAELGGSTKAAVIVELADLAARLGLVRDSTWFVGALIQRENVLPTAPGNGVAILHTIRRHPEQITKPFMVLGRSFGGVDYDALDGKPTHVFFVLGLKYDELHLPWLAKLVQMLAQPGALRALLAAPDARAIHEVLVDAERRLGGAAGKGA